MDEEFFRNTIACLKQINANFWLERGTLLGLIRDGKPIPWDRDFDVGLWQHEMDKEKIIKIFIENGFFPRSLFPLGIEGIHVFPDQYQINKRFDVIFYTKKRDRAQHCSALLRQTIRSKFLGSIERFLDPAFKARQPVKRLVEVLFHDKIFPILPERLKILKLDVINYLISKNYIKEASLTYDFPAAYFMHLRSAQFLGVEVRIPENFEGYLAEAYGSDWRIPRRWRNWSEGATHKELLV